MADIAILIPTYGRFERFEAIVKNIRDTTVLPYEVYFLCEAEDTKSIRETKRMGGKCIECHGNSYVSAINEGYRQTTEPFLLLGSDDIEFTMGWDVLMKDEFKDPKIGIVGHTDEWEISKTGKHGSHLMVRREYIEKHSGVQDESNVIYSSQYYHIMCDIETEQTAMKRGAFAMSKAFISHKHWFMKTAPMDKTYQRAIDVAEKDRRTYNQRRGAFEVYKFEDLFTGKVTEKPKEGLTVVIPSFFELHYLKQTIESLKENTSQPYELIIIDDGSDKETIDYINTLDCIKVFNKEQRYVNANWNTGIEMATNRWVVIANNDITFSKDWDKFLIEAMQEDGVWITSPFQTDPEYPKAYGKHERSGNINLRGSCFMIDKEMIATTGYIPTDMLIWFGDWWFTWIVEKNNHKCVFTDKAVIHHYGSKSSINMMQDKKKLFFQILRGDAYAFKLHTGINVDHWLKIIYDNLNLPVPV